MTIPVTNVVPSAEATIKDMERTIPVYPFNARCEGGDEVQNWGLHLRDYFAAMALSGMAPDAPAEMAARAYARADAMLAARGKTP